jgi:hypothetical protein
MGAGNHSNLTGTNPVTIPDEQIARQAVASLGGYVHQIVRTVGEWIRLPHDGKLLIEVAEDYATLARGVLTMAQVKAITGPSTTLRSGGARKAISSLLQFQEANPDLHVRLVYLTTADAGRENGANLPQKLGGIHYWRQVARGADVEPLRKLLIDTQVDPKVTEFVKHATPDELRLRLIDPIQWEVGADPSKAAIRGLEAKLRALAADRTGFTEDGERALPFLIYRALLASVANERILTRDDFEQEWSRATTMSVSYGFIRQASAAMAAGSVSTLGIKGPPAPALLTRLARRAPLVDDLTAVLSSAGVLWLHGSSGLGKSQLARLLAARSNRQWRFVALKDCSDAEAQGRVRDAIGGVLADDFGGLVLDDLPVPAKEGLRHWIAAAAREVAATKGGAIIVTTDREPLPQIRAALEPLGITVRAAPYLQQADVTDIVNAAGGDSTHWAAAIYLTCGSGHPLLVDARTAGLASRGWPAEDRLSGLGIGAGPEEVADVRKEVTLRLLGELSSDAHQLLLRLSVLLGPFDRSMMDAAAAAQPPVPRAGALFELLVGPWIEMKSEDRYSLSPLVLQAGATGLSEEERKAVQTAAIDDLLAHRPFPGDLLAALIIHAAVLRHLPACMFIAKAVLEAKDRAAIALHCLPLLFLKSPDNVRILPEHPGVSIMLRAAQVAVAANAPHSSMIDSVLVAAMRETDTLPDILQAANRYTILITVLGSEHLDARPNLWMPLLVVYREMMRTGAVPVELTDTMIEPDLGGLNTEQFFFVIRTRKIDSVEDLVEMFEQLNGIEAEWRHELLQGSTKLLGGPPMFVQTAWSNAALAKQLDARKAADHYRGLADMAIAWGESDIAIECLRSRAVMFDEYLGDSDAALRVLDEADARYPGNARLARSRATVLATAGRHQEELAVLSTLTETYSLDEPLERVMTLRVAAISAFRVGDYREAGRLFRLAHDTMGDGTTTLHGGVRPGLLCDAAVADVLGGDFRSALGSFRDALVALDQLDADEDERVLFASQAAVQSLQWALSKAEQLEFPVDMAQHPGLCSTIQPTLPEARGERQARTFSWYVLARLEAVLDIDAGIGGLLEGQEGEHGIVIKTAAGVRASQLDQAILRRDVDKLFTVLPPFVSFFSSLARERSAGKEPDSRLTRIEIIPPAQWDEDEGSIARAPVSAMIGVLLIDGRELEAHSVAARGAAMSPWLDDILDRGPPSLGLGQDFISTGIGAVRWLIANSSPNAEQLLGVSARIFMWIAHIGAPTAVPALWPLLRDTWLDLVRNRPAILSMPRFAGPAIEAAANDDANIGSIARLIEAATLGASTPLPEHVRTALQKASRNGLGA